MIKNKHKLAEFYKHLLQKEDISYRQALAIFDSLYREAVTLGVINSANIMDGLEVDIKIAKTINSLI